MVDSDGAAAALPDPDGPVDESRNTYTYTDAVNDNVNKQAAVQVLQPSTSPYLSRTVNGGKSKSIHLGFAHSRLY